MTCEAVMNKRSVGSIYEQLAAEQLINMDIVYLPAITETALER